MREPLDTMRDRAFRPVAVAYSAGQVVDWLVEVALALAVYERTGSATASALVFVALRVMPVVALPLAAGRSLAALSAARALAALVLAAGVEVLPVWALLAVGLADGAGSLAGRAGSRAAAVQLLGTGDRVRAGNAVLNIAFSVAAAAAPIGAGILVGGAGAAAALALAALLAAAGAAAVRGATPTPAPSRAASPRGPRALPRLVTGSGSGALIALETLLLVLFTAAVPVELAYAVDSLGAGEAGYGVLLAAWGAGMVAGSVAFGALGRAGLPTLALGATLAVAGAYALMGVAPSLPVACAGALLGGAGNGVQWVAFVSWLQRRSPAELALPLAALLESIAALAPGVGFLLGGGALALLEPRATLLAVAGAIALVVCAWLGAAALGGGRRAAGRSRRSGARPWRLVS